LQKNAVQNLSNFENERFSKLIYAIFAVVHNTAILSLNNFSERKYSGIIYEARLS